MSRIITINYIKYEIRDLGSSKEAYVSGFDHRKKFKTVRIPSSILHNGEIISVVGFQYNCFDGLIGNRIEIPNTFKFNGVDLSEHTGESEEQNGVTLYIYEARESNKDKKSFNIGDFVKEINAQLSALFIKKRCVLTYATSDNRKLEIKPDAFDSPIESHTFRKGEGRIVFKQGITQIKESAFEKKETLTSITIPKGVQRIEDWAFSKCENLQIITIPESVTYIGCSVIDYSWNLKRINISSLSSWCKIKVDTIFSGINYSRETEVYLNDKLITDLRIPFTATELTPIFRGYKKLESVTIPNSITKLYATRQYSSCNNLKAFYGKFASSDNRCLIDDGSLMAFAPAGLTEYAIPNGVTRIVQGFTALESLKEITIPETVSSISFEFWKCKKLERVYCKSIIPPYIDDKTFTENNPKLKIYVPSESEDAYKAAKTWVRLADIIEPYDFR